jgi:hypothetical protein
MVPRRRCQLVAGLSTQVSRRGAKGRERLTLRTRHCIMCPFGLSLCHVGDAACISRGREQCQSLLTATDHAGPAPGLVTLQQTLATQHSVNSSRVPLRTKRQPVRAPPAQPGAARTAKALLRTHTRCQWRAKSDGAAPALHAASAGLPCAAPLPQPRSSMVHASPAPPDADPRPPWFAQPSVTAPQTATRGLRRQALGARPQRAAAREACLRHGGHALLVGLGAERHVHALAVDRAQRVGAQQRGHGAHLRAGGPGRARQGPRLAFHACLC